MKFVTKAYFENGYIHGIIKVENPISSSGIRIIDAEEAISDMEEKMDQEVDHFLTKLSSLDIMNTDISRKVFFEKNQINMLEVILIKSALKDKVQIEIRLKNAGYGTK